MLYGIIFWGNSSHSNNIFKLQKKDYKNYHKLQKLDLFKKLNILQFYSQYIFSLLIFVIDNISLFKTNSELYEINTRNKNNFHPSQPRLSIYRKYLIFVFLSINVTFTFYFLLFVDMFQPHTAIFRCYSILSRSWCSFLPMSGCQPCAPADGVLIVSVRVLEYLCCLCGLPNKQINIL
jgi:hypothetical protein